MEIRPGLGAPDNAVADFCRRHSIRRLAVLGSALRDDFRDDSDVDLLVEFEPAATPGLLAIAAMEIELGDLFGREVELRTYEDLSRHFRDRVRTSARELYADLDYALAVLSNYGDDAARPISDMAQRLITAT